MSPSERMLVTGGAGFIGSHLVEALLDRGFAVRVVDNLVTGRRSNLAHLEGSYEWVEGDLADFELCRQAVEGVACVFHEAAIPSVPRSVKEPLLSHLTGPTATLNLLEAARFAGVRRFLFAASSSAYGETTELPKHENMLPQPLSPYAAGGASPAKPTWRSTPARRPDGRELAILQHLRAPPGIRRARTVVRDLHLRASAWPRASRRSSLATARRLETSHMSRMWWRRISPRWITHNRLKVPSSMLEPAGAISLLELVAAINRFQGTDIQPGFWSTRGPATCVIRQASLERIGKVLDYRPIVDFEEEPSVAPFGQVEFFGCRPVGRAAVCSTAGQAGGGGGCRSAHVG